MASELINSEKLNQLKRELFLDEGFYNGLIKKYRQNQKLLEDFLKQNPSLSNIDPRFFQEVQDMLLMLKWYSFNYLTDQEIIEMFRNHVSVVLNDDTFPIEEALKIAFLGMSILNDRDVLKKQIKEALLQNKEKITSQLIKLKDSSVEGTIGNWLQLYNSVVGVELVDSLKLAEFFVKNKNFTALMDLEAGKIKKLLALYEKLKLSSLTPEGLEEEELEEAGEGRVILMTGTGAKEVYDIEGDKKEGLVKEELLTPETKAAIAVASPSTIKENLVVTPIVNQAKEFVKDLENMNLPNSSEFTNNVISTKTEPDFEKIIQNIVGQAGLSFTDENLKTRFIGLITSYLKGVRKELDLRDALMRGEKVGGMGYDQQKITAIMNILAGSRIEEKESMQKETTKPALAEGLTSPIEIINPVTPDLSREPGKLLEEGEDALLTGSTQKTSDNIEVQQEKFSSGSLAPVVDDSKIPENVSSSFENIVTSEEEPIKQPPAEDFLAKFDLSSAFGSDKTEEADQGIKSQEASDMNIDASIEDLNSQLAANNVLPTEEAKPTELVEPASISEPEQKIVEPSDGAIKNIYRAPEPEEAPQPPIEEVRVTPRAYGPVDELRSLTLEDWRRWGGVGEAVKLILDKINLLAEESLTKKSEGIAAWKGSEINKMYLDIGTEAINNGLSVEQAIEKRKSANLPTLTIDEFNAISEINQKLRF
ncbi:MAG: hypothetical protein PHV78_03100 [Patescibacteria group bacterium]|nr:hypothetical protein [Patescibacteria group bacterium]MDD5121627.1 hypothetical protein [Patescibacteria group bacterium]MDD5221942.1 hypothetical protein [Patescibacteria group bacterium]MDD5396209.1 hypothetical protein [Patescibacteria group bacterium]